jgi:hypothetical protein
MGLVPSWAKDPEIGIRADCTKSLFSGRGSRRIELRRVGEVVAAEGRFVVVGADGAEIESVVRYLRDLALGDASPLTCRSYGFDLPRWFRLLWCLGVDWERATSSEVAVLVGWVRRSTPTGGEQVERGKRCR